jgi:HEAT repeat protein
LGDERLAEALMDAMRRLTNSAFGWPFERALESMGATAIPILRKAAKEAGIPGAAAVRVLQKAGKPGFLALLEAYSDPGVAVSVDFRFRDLLFSCMSLEHEAAEAVPLLMKGCVHESEYVRGLAISSLGYIGPAASAALPLIREQIGVGGKPGLRNAATKALALISPQSASEAKDAKDASDLAELKGRPQEFQEMSRAADAASSWDRARMIREFFSRAFEKAEERQEIAPALARVAVPVLMRWLKDSDPAVREEAAGWFYGFGHHAKEAIPALIEAKKDTSGYAVAKRAQYSLEHIDPERFGGLPTKNTSSH